jgi:hypothetical protein
VRLDFPHATEVNNAFDDVGYSMFIASTSIIYVMQCALLSTPPLGTGEVPAMPPYFIGPLTKVTYFQLLITV